MKTVVVHCKRSRYDIYIGRPDQRLLCGLQQSKRDKSLLVVRNEFILTVFVILVYVILALCRGYMVQYKSILDLRIKNGLSKRRVVEWLITRS